ncbi:MAG: hypothetical protein AMK73_08585 [Planctomycetes bacterium SM23_32]|nr:MAG: hypothetical protein AMK73_08585 [Planctomycetes bacterium SM23_32]
MDNAEVEGGPHGVTLGAEQGVTTWYRYRSVADATRLGRAEDTLTRDRVWLTKAADLNDPFECRFKISFEGSTHEKVTSYAAMLERQGRREKEGTFGLDICRIA